MSVALEIDGNRYAIEVLTVQRIDSHRTAIKVRSQASMQRGRSCVIVANEKVIPCVVFNTTQMGDAYITEFRCLEDCNFLTER